LIVLVLFVAAFFAGIINSLAGGGTLLTFPSLLAYGIPSITANATSTIALVPGSFSSFWGYRNVKHGPFADELRFLAVSAAGGLLGAIALLGVGDATFTKLVPWLILGATALFVLQDPLRRWREKHKAPDADSVLRDGAGGFPKRALAAQFLVGIYGGFFGAGAGIVMLAVLGYFGLTNIHQMNRLKNLAGVTFNTVASITFIVGRHVDWKLAAIMTVGSVVGGYSGAGVATFIGEKNVRRFVIAIGLVVGVVTLVKTYYPAR
jgi:uncharacterized membrane protein YfcA